MTKFHGSLDDLKDRLLPLDLDGEWEEKPNSVWKLKCKDRSGLFWSITKGTIWFDGPAAQKDMPQWHPCGVLVSAISKKL